MTSRRRRRTRHGLGVAAGAGASQQRFGHVTSGQQPTGGSGAYIVADDTTGQPYTFEYADIVTEGFRNIRTGERVRFLTDPAQPGHAVYVIRLDLPDVEDYYEPKGSSYLELYLS